MAGRDAILRSQPDANVSLFVGDTADEQTVAARLTQMNTIAPLKKVLANAGIGDLRPLPPKMPINTTRSCGSTPRGRYWFSNMPPEYCLTNGGALCAISSIAGLRTHPHMAAYCMSKAAIDMLVRNCADELGASAIE